MVWVVAGGVGFVLCFSFWFVLFCLLKCPHMFWQYRPKYIKLFNNSIIFFIVFQAQNLIHITKNTKAKEVTVLKSKFRLLYMQCGNHSFMNERNELSSQSTVKEKSRAGDKWKMRSSHCLAMPFLQS